MQIPLLLLPAALAATAIAFAQPAKMPRVGVLANTIPMAELVAGTGANPAPRMLVEGLGELGWSPGRNIELVYRSAEGDYSRLPALARELAATSDVIVAYGPGVEAAIHATEKVPIVMGASGVFGREMAGKVVRIESLAKPGGNVTGLTLVPGREINGKRLSLIKEAAPRVSRVAILGHTSSHARAVIGPVTRAAAAEIGVSLSPYAFGSDAGKLDAVFAEMARDGIDSLLVLEMPATNLAPVQAAIHRLAERHRMVAMHEVLGAADSGGLMSYGHDIQRLYRRAPYFVDRILRGAKPGDLPIEQPTQFELRLDLKAARALGLTFPQGLLLQADRVVE
jgi:putative tryptophan/tyrosine transport system substrate-binding protein